MSAPLESLPQIELDITAVRQSGKTRHLITVRIGDRVLHADSLDLASSRSRAQFLRDLEPHITAAGATWNRSAIEQVLLGQVTKSQAPGMPSESVRQREGQHQLVLAAFGIDVLREREDQSIECWIPATGKRWVIKSPARWAPEEMLQALGVAGEHLLWQEESPAPPSRYTPTELRRAVAIASASAPRLASEALIGQGIWRHGENFLVVNGASAHLYNGQEFEAVTHPRLGKKIIDFDASAAWAEGLNERTRSMTVERARESLRELQSLLSRWNWTHEQDHIVQGALVVATFIQTCWTWRPLNSIIGRTDAGKSTLLQDLLRPVFGDWTLAADRSTEAGLRQAIGHNATPVIIDEFDEYRQRQQVLELFRTSSRGGIILRGTQNQAGQQFGIKHLGWFASIESGDIWGADRNRFIRAELRQAENRGGLVLPGHGELQELGQSLVAAALWGAAAATELADAIKRTRIDGIHGRLVESFSVPAAMHSVLMHGREVTVSQAESLLREMIDGREALQGQGEADETRLLNDILATNIRVSIQQSGHSLQAERTIAQILDGHMRPLGRDPIALDTLQAAGVNVVRHDGTEMLFFSPDMVRRQLLVGTRWEKTQFEQILVRLPGALRSQQRCGGQRHRGVLVPMPEGLRPERVRTTGGVDRLQHLYAPGHVQRDNGVTS